MNSKVNRILHHGTLLYDSNIIKLNGSIKPTKPLAIKTHAVDSVRSPVMNMREVADLGETSDFLTQLIETLSHDLKAKSIQKITPSDYPDVNELVTSKQRLYFGVRYFLRRISQAVNSTLNFIQQRFSFKFCRSFNSIIPGYSFRILFKEAFVHLRYLSNSYL